MNAWKHKVFCTWEFRIISICMNKYTTQRKMFKVSIIQVCVRYKMGQLTAEQRIFFRLWLIWKGVHFFDTPCILGRWIVLFPQFDWLLISGYPCNIHSRPKQNVFRLCSSYKQIFVLNEATVPPNTKKATNVSFV
jgi:hypothetical protein